LICGFIDEHHRIVVLDGADGGTGLAFLESLLGRWAKSSLFWVASNVRMFLKFTGRTDLVSAVNLVGVKRFHAILPVLDDGDEELVTFAAEVAGIPLKYSGSFRPVY
jgi:hypothetical protein